MMKERYFYNIDFLRFIFCIAILLHHFSAHTTIFIRNNISQFIDLQLQFECGYICVEFFFIISGFLWSLSLDRQISLLNFAKKKIIRFFPLMLFAVACFGVICLLGLLPFEWIGNILALLFLSGFGFKHSFNVYEQGNIYSCWFISILFWVLLLYQYLYNKQQKVKFNLFIILMIVFGFGIIINVPKGDLWNPLYRVLNIFNTGLFRGLYSVAIGYLVGEIYKAYYPKLKNIKLKLISKTLLTAINLLALYFIMFDLFYFTTIDNYIFFVLCFTIVMLCFVFNKDKISQFFNNKYFAFMGKYTLSIYILHNVIMDIFKYGLFTDKNISVVSLHPYLFFYSGIIISVIFGILTYYLVEMPVAKYLSKFIKDF